MSLPTDDALRHLLTEFDTITIGLAPDGFTATVASVPVTTAASLADLLDALSSAAVAQQVVDVLHADDRRDRQPPRGVVVKAAPDQDLYAIWNSTVDDFVFAGTREDMRRAGVQESALARADVHGTSARWFSMPEPYPVPYRPYGWDDEAFLLNNQPGPLTSGLLARGDLAEFLRTRPHDPATAAALLRPTDD